MMNILSGHSLLLMIEFGGGAGFSGVRSCVLGRRCRGVGVLKLGCLVMILVTANPDTLVRIQVGQMVQPAHLMLMMKLMMMLIMILMYFPIAILVLVITAERAHTTTTLIIMIVTSTCCSAVIDWWLGLAAWSRYLLWLLLSMMVVMMVKIISVWLLIA